MDNQEVISMFQYIDDAVEHVMFVNENQLLFSFLIHQKRVIGIAKQSEILITEEVVDGAFWFSRPCLMRIPDVFVADVIHAICDGGKPDLVEAVFKNIADNVLFK